jgi:O-antigen chain-terminating methyltransferase
VFTLDALEIRDEEINVEDIMQKIREKIKRWKELGSYPESELQQRICPPGEQPSLCKTDDQVLDQKMNDLLTWPDKIRRDLDGINFNWDIQNNSYFISSHRPYTGKFLIKGRVMVHSEVKRYVDPMIFKQTEFNGSVTRILNEIMKNIYEISKIAASAHASTMGLNETNSRISEISQRMNDLENITIGKIRSENSDKVEEQIRLVKNEIHCEVDEKIGLGKTEITSKVEEQIKLVKNEIHCEVDEQIGLSKTEIASKVEEQIEQIRSVINNEISTQVRAIVSVMNQEIENRAWLAKILERKVGGYQDFESSVSTQELGRNYFLFEERFRGSREDIKQRQTEFVHYFEGCKNVLDIGCGRGEFLELLQENGIFGHGVDVDENMVDFCLSKGFDVEKIDAISYLEKIEDNSLDGILLDQVVEHLEPDYLIKMLRLCHKKLKLGSHILIETVNPLSLVSFINFYLDMSHKRPIHPNTLNFLMESANFREMVTKFVSPIPDEMRLKKIDVDTVNEKNRDVYNHNIDMLNNILYGAQDYMVIGKR